MADMQATLTVRADTAQADSALQKSTRATKTYERANKEAAAAVSSSMAAAAEGTERASQKMQRESAKFLRSLQREAEQTKRTRAEYLEFRAAQLGVANLAAPFVARMRDAERAIGDTGISAGQTAAAMRMVPAQITDIVTTLAGGMPVWQVAIQQGGQLKDSFGGLGPMFRNLATLITPMRVVMGGLAGAVGTVALAYAHGSAEFDGYVKALALGNNAVGATAGHLANLARQVAEVTGSQAQASSAIAAMAQSGQVARENLAAFAQTAIQLERDVGVPVEETVKAFEELGRAPVEASLKLNEAHRYLTLAVYDQIKALEDQGRKAEAAALAQRSYGEAMNKAREKVVENAGIMERAWDAVKSAAAKAWDAMLGIGRERGLREELERAQANVAFFQKEVDSGRASASSRQALEAAKAQVESLQRRVDTTEGLAAVEGEVARRQQAGVDAQKANAQWTEKTLGWQQKLNAALAEYRRNNEAMREAGKVLDSAQVAREEAAIRESFTPKGGGAGGARESAAARMLEQLRRTEASLSAQLEQEGKLGAAARERAQFEQTIADLKARGSLTADERSLLASQDILRTQLARNEAIEREVAMRDLIARKLEEERQAQEKFLQAAAGIHEQLATLREGRVDQYGRQLEVVGRGDAERARIEAQSSIYREHERAQARLSREASRAGTLGSEQYVLEVVRIKQSLDRALADHDAYYAALVQASADWSTGASRAMENYLESARNVAAQTEQAMTSAMRGMEDALVAFVTTGKADFKSLANSILADIARMQVKQMFAGGSGGGFAGFLGDVLGLALGSGAASAGGAALGSGLSTTGIAGGIGGGRNLPGLAFGGAREFGGPVAAGKSYWVGERGPERFVPATAGTIVPAGKSGGDTYQFNTTLHAAPGLNVAQLQSYLDQRDAQLKADVAESLRRGRWAGAL